MCEILSIKSQYNFLLKKSQYRNNLTSSKLWREAYFNSALRSTFCYRCKPFKVWFTHPSYNGMNIRRKEVGKYQIQSEGAGRIIKLMNDIVVMLKHAI